MELDAQPNNVNRELTNGLGPRSKTTLLGDYHYNRHRHLQQQHQVNNGFVSPVGSASMRDLSLGKKTPVISGPGADVLFGDKARRGGGGEKKLEQKFVLVGELSP